MNCHEAARHLPGYLDGEIESSTQQVLRVHLDGCHNCRDEAERYRLMSRALSNLEAMPVPPDLALKIRIHASKATPMRSFAHRVNTRLSLVFGNILAPIALPATGGVLATIGVFVLLLQNLMVGVPMGSIVANDLQLNLVQPAYLESLGPIPAPTFDMGLTLDATVNAQGQAVDYKIISGPTDPVAQRQIDQLMLLSKFRPRLNDGRPTSGGHVVLNFNSIRVKG
jgi:anti-sigma factor RsiW